MKRTVDGFDKVGLREKGKARAAHAPWTAERVRTEAFGTDEGRSGGDD